jgi:methylmalonyl-CoA/ethylmalonyl-CoA epimerase
MDPGPSRRPPATADRAATAGPGGIPATRLDHTAICVKDMDAAVALFEALLGKKAAHREKVASQKVSAAFFDFPNGASLELVSPDASLGGNPGLEKFLEKRGDALHHLALRVRDIDAVLDALAARGVPLIDRVSRPGARGHKVAFLHPKAMGGTLLELVEAHEEPVSSASGHDPR